MPVYVLGHVNPSRYDMVERKMPKETRKEELPSRRRRCEKEEK